MSRQYYMPPDPECSEVRDYRECLLNDPMTIAMHAPVDEILEDFDRTHVQNCERCREYGLANVEIV